MSEQTKLFKEEDRSRIQELFEGKEFECQLTSEEKEMLKEKKESDQYNEIVSRVIVLAEKLLCAGFLLEDAFETSVKFLEVADKYREAE